MNLSRPEINIIFEHRFWLQILGDHSRFIFNSLAPDENEYISTAQDFITLFDSLLARAKKDLSEKESISLTQDAYKAAQSIRNFKIQLLKQQLTGKIKIELPPTFINHMLNELEEYLNLLYFALTDKQLYESSIHNHLLWLPDASGHASTITGQTDMVEKNIIKRSMKFAKTFDYLYLKAIEMSGYMRTGLKEFNSLDRFNSEVELEISSFQVFLGELEQLVTEKKLLGTIIPLILDHMNREECYYLTKLSQVSKIKKPSCDPTKARVES